MCGIAGFVNRDGEAADRGVLARMTATLAHRGPDGDGLYVDGPAALGHRRLSIIDVAGGAQPMSNEDGSVWVTYNGELYNEPELRARLLARGPRLPDRVATPRASSTSTRSTGADFARQLNGMFALAIWDRPRRRLVLARDRMGQKPLYYAETARRRPRLRLRAQGPARPPRRPPAARPARAWPATSSTSTSPPRTRSGTG